MEVIDAMQTQAKALADPSRFRLFRFIADATDPVGVADLTDLLGFNHNAIRQHLAVLVAAGIIAESDEVRRTRGRPRKQYELRADALDAFGSVAGSYERLASLLLEMVETGDSPYEVGYRAATADTTPSPTAEHGEQIERLIHRLMLDGFEPKHISTSEIALNNCPFAEVAQANPRVVCELHRGLINGQIGAHNPDRTVSLEPHDPTTAGCLVGITGKTQPK